MEFNEFMQNIQQISQLKLVQTNLVSYNLQLDKIKNIHVSIRIEHFEHLKLVHVSFRHFYRKRIIGQ